MRQPRFCWLACCYSLPCRRWRSAACSGTNPVAAQLLLPRDVSAAANERPIGINLLPDGKELVYSMGGSLWRQTIGDDQARELIHAGGYDYQPDWSHDGRHIIFTRYQKDAIELWQLDLQTGTESR